MKTIIYPGYDLSQYSITEDGRVWSNISNRFLKGLIKPDGYHMVFLNKKWFYIHRLIAFTYLIIPDNWEELEVNHHDMNKSNNHYSNIEWMTHKENLIEAHKLKKWSGCGREKGFKIPDDIKILMNKDKQKKVSININNNIYTYNSIEELCAGIGWYRRKFNRALNAGKYDIKFL
jgi:hypothetical protein